MVRNRFLAACAAISLAATMITPVFAVDSWHPSETNNGASQSTSNVTVNVSSSDFIGVNDFKITSDVSVYNEGEDTDAHPRIIVSNVSASVSGVYDDTVTDNVAWTKELYQAALGKTAAEFVQQEADLPTFEAKAEALVGKKVSADQFVMASMFDVTPDDIALQIIKANGGVTLTFDTPGITADGKYLAIHFKSNGTSEVLDVVPGNGTATITFGTEFSPIMILKYEEDANSDSSTKIVDTGDDSNALVYGIVAGVAVVVAAVAIIVRKKAHEED